VFTRTKFGANNVAEYLCKNGINAMALHGNKSQSARTQALGGFKSGEIRALVATDIAARGIDIDELPHVVNYEIPNVPEDYVHRIGRTGRAGNEGAAVSFVCLDEEGWMQEIERFTKQRIPSVVVPGFEAEAGEKGEPIAMGRQTIWGGAGRPPSREVMMAAAKAARQEMMQRIRDNKAADGARGGDRAGKPKQPQGQRSANGNGNGNGNGARAGNGARNGSGNGARNGNGAPRQGARPPQQGRPANGYAPRQDDDGQPRDGAHNSSSPFVQRDAPPEHTDGQPNPLRTSVDSMGGRGRRGNGGGRSNRGAGGGFGPRGPGNPARTFGR
jgi:ATP-dependent RNA helicase RhlE